MNGHSSKKFKNKYRIPSSRLKTWDYSNEGAYFITICTRNKEHFFGKIIDGEMRLTEIGKYLEQQWMITPSLRPDMNLELDQFVVMPNHFHGIIIIGENQYNTNCKINNDCHVTENDRSEDDGPHAGGFDGGWDDWDGWYVRVDGNGPANRFGPQSKNLTSIIRGVKTSVTTHATKTGNRDFAWQARFHDHIIRNTAEFYRIRNYIMYNPDHWMKDRFYG